MEFKSLEEMNELLINCMKCPRLVEFRKSVALRKNRFYGEIYWSRPVPGFGNHDGKLLILGLAPAATGGNRTGRIFTGDKSAQFLVNCLYKVGFTNKSTSENANDGLIYYDAYVTAVLKCVPPNDKPTLDELNNCSPYMEYEIETMKNLKAILVLGRIAFESLKRYLKKKGINIQGMEFKHGTFYEIDNNKRIYCSYHPSPRNVNTGRIKSDDLINILNDIKNYIYA
ncbi:MAG: uracil-DNA glycosylase [Thermoplasmata archaeon]|nr:uracil-DNA glycosylase [Thermoplasmata archaeon]